MKNIFKISLLALMTLTGVVACGQTNNSSGDFLFPSIDMENHEHVYDQEVASAAYRSEGNSCGSAAKYYYSCICGAKGEETFTYGEAKAHEYQLIISGNYKTKYLTGERVSTENMVAKLICTNQDSEFEIDNKDLILPKDGLTKGTKSCDISYEKDGQSYSTSIAVTVDSYRVSNVDLVAREGRMYYQVSGEYGEGYKEVLERARLSLTVYNDYFEIGKKHPTCTPAGTGETYGSWLVEIDITDINPTNNIGAKQSKNVYWPHFFIEDDKGVMQNTDLTFPEMDEYISKKLDENSKDTYQIYKYYQSTKKIYNPVVGKLCTESVPTTQYYYSTESDELPAVGSTYTLNGKSYTAGEAMYMFTEADINEVEGAARITLSGKLRGFASADQFIKVAKFYFHTYSYTTKESDSTTHTYSGNHTFIFGDIAADVEKGTFYMNVEASGMGLSLLSATGSTTGDGTATSKSGSYYFRSFSNTTGEGDIRIMSTKNHNKSVTVEGRKYTLYCNKDGGSEYQNVWGCIGFGIDKA